MTRVSGVALLLLGWGLGCSDQVGTCKESRACESTSGGASEGSGGSTTGSSGGSNTGGDTGSGASASGGSNDPGTGGQNNDGGETSTGSTPGTGGEPQDPCDACEGETPACTNESECVPCTETDSGSCGEDEYCSTENECVQCLQNSHCTEPDASVCISDTQDQDFGTCQSCSQDTDCEHLSDTPACETTTNSCVACTVDNETACNGNSCDPATNTCTTTELGSVDVCGACLADSECHPDHRCVPMDFKGQEREGLGFCLKDSTVGDCDVNPYRSLSAARVSLSGAKEATYCTINETLTTCEAVLDLDDDKDCTSTEDCGATGLDDGLCEKVTNASNKCTYECDSPAQCRTNDPGSTCAGDATGPAGKYCGG